MFIWHIRWATCIIVSLYLPLWNFIVVFITFTKFSKYTKGTEGSASYSEVPYIQAYMVCHTESIDLVP